jgi:two-component system phosphate regulon sensor histidine kinase PhoR
MEPLLLIGAVVVALIVGLWSGTTLGSRRRDASGARAPGTETVDPATPAGSPLATTAGTSEVRGSMSGGPPLEPEAIALLGGLTLGVVHVDDRLLVTYANPGAATLLGHTAAWLPGRSVMEVFIDRRIESLIEDARDGTPTSADLQSREVEGRQLVLRARRSPSQGVWLVLEDVTELRRLQQIRREFIDNLSHELRTPLTTVSLLAETLGREATTSGEAIPPRMRDRIGKIEVETGHLVQMVNELLDLSRIESGPPLVLPDDIDVGRLAATSAERLRLFADRQGVRLAVEASDDLPTIRGNEERLGQVLVNLIHNAVKFSPDGGDVIVRVRHETGPSADEVAIAVEDHGIGIPRAAQARIFERFYKVDRARVRGGGTGLGLAIARHIVEAHGGRIELESEEGSGSTFAVHLPVAAPVGDGDGSPDAAVEAARVARA